jgi:hypothetical protein
MGTIQFGEMKPLQSKLSWKDLGGKVDCCYWDIKQSVLMRLKLEEVWFSVAVLRALAMPGTFWGLPRSFPQNMKRLVLHARLSAWRRTRDKSGDPAEHAFNRFSIVITSHAAFGYFSLRGQLGQRSLDRRKRNPCCRRDF